MHTAEWIAVLHVAHIHMPMPVAVNAESVKRIMAIFAI